MKEFSVKFSDKSFASHEFAAIVSKNNSNKTTLEGATLAPEPFQR